jgi:hypothetical protein
MKCKFCDTQLVLVHVSQDKDDSATVVVACACSTYAGYPSRVIVHPEEIKEGRA